MKTESTVFVFEEDIESVSVGEGVERKILGYDRELMMVQVKFRKGSIGYLHIHPHRQVTYIVSGSFDVTIGSEKKRQKAGDCYFIPPQVEHGVVALEDSTLIDVFSPAREDFLR
jgi:quercetin dioxygenase-like cupin family protein